MRQFDLCFNGGVDVQHTLPYGTTQQIREEVHNIVSILQSLKGGFIMGASHTILPDVPIKNMKALIETIEEYTRV